MILGFLISVIYWPGIMGAPSTPRWALLSVAVPLLLWAVRIRLTLPSLVGGLFLAWCALSLLWTPDVYDGLHALWKFAILAGLFCWGMQQDPRPVFIGLGIGVTVNSVLMVAQAFGLDEGLGIHQKSIPGGLFGNGNFAAEFAVLTLMGLIGYRLWWLTPFPVVAIMFTSARGAVVALAAAFLGWLWTKSRLASAALALAGVALGWFMLSCSGHCVGHGGTGPQRLMVWNDTLGLITWHGQGIGSYLMSYPQHRFVFEHAHNDLLQIAAETGIGVFLFAAFLAFVAMGEGLTERLILLAFMVIGLVGYPLYLPGTAFVAALVAGRLCRSWPDLCHSLSDWRERIHARQYRPEGKPLLSSVPRGRSLSA